MTDVFWNGDFVPADRAVIVAEDRGLLHGRGLFETFRAREGRVLALDRHYQRLREGCDALGVALPLTLRELETAIDALARRLGLDDARMRLTVTAGAEGGAPAILLTARQATDYPSSLYERGASAVIASVRRNETSVLSRVKSLNCLDNVLAREEARRRGADEALLLNTSGRLAEGAFANLFVVLDGEIVTPPVDEGALPGVTRAVALDLARSLGLRAREAPLEPAALARATEAFLTNAVAGVLPLTAVEGRPVGNGAPGPLTETLREAYAALLTRPAPGR
ncbi:MAG TPA: aminotransferase class IV [Dehalococcoidia bacterium]|nr:aminotransferase class IV [Dehalococcoidia bacterium]